MKKLPIGSFPSFLFPVSMRDHVIRTPTQTQYLNTARLRNGESQKGKNFQDVVD
jgi:hypothetical protein